MRIIISTDNPRKAVWNMMRAETEGKKRHCIADRLNAEGLCRYFDGVGRRALESDAQSSLASYMKWLHRGIIDNRRSFYLESACETDLLEIIQSLKNNKTKDCYGLSTAFLKQIAPELVNPCLKVIDKCTEHDYFPNQ